VDRVALIEDLDRVGGRSRDLDGIDDELRGVALVSTSRELLAAARAHLHLGPPKRSTERRGHRGAQLEPPGPVVEPHADQERGHLGVGREHHASDLELDVALGDRHDVGLRRLLRARSDDDDDDKPSDAVHDGRLPDEAGATA
jgi:hypothetical protein